jgi:hypothetical protein
MRALVTIVALVMLLVPTAQLVSSVPSHVAHQLTAKAGVKTSHASRVLAAIVDVGAEERTAPAAGRITAVDRHVSLPGFPVELFVPPRV